MKSLTEFSGVVVRMAAAALAEARRALPAEEASTNPAVDASAASAPAAEPGAAELGAAETPVAESSPAEAQPAQPEGAATPPTDAAAAPAAKGESEAVSAALSAAVASATGLSGDRLEMLRAAVEVAGKRTADVRTIRVFGPEEPVPGAKSVGGRQYLVDYLPQNMKQVAGSPKDERGRGGRGGGGGRGGRGGGGGGGGGARGGGAGAGATGGFSMDSLRDDRKSERGGGRRPGGAPRGGPKK